MLVGAGPEVTAGPGRVKLGGSWPTSSSSSSCCTLTLPLDSVVGPGGLICVSPAMFPPAVGVALEYTVEAGLTTSIALSCRLSFGELCPLSLSSSRELPSGGVFFRRPSLPSFSRSFRRLSRLVFALSLSPSPSDPLSLSLSRLLGRSESFSLSSGSPAPLFFFRSLPLFFFDPPETDRPILSVLGLLGSSVSMCACASLDAG
mmetsp:Transcript_44415/g.121035  ORF Transcript_44415/g.121035 Transcript_44415/m.121035 type:complete len:203 (-) Transcript_44415:2157-2765(-)